MAAGSHRGTTLTSIPMMTFQMLGDVPIATRDESVMAKRFATGEGIGIHVQCESDKRCE